MRSFLFITLDSCRFDTFVKSDIPAIKGVGPYYRAMSPGNFTFSSHKAMFVGFTPGIPSEKKSFLNPKYGKIFKMVNGGFTGKGTEYLELGGRNIIDGFKINGFAALGTAAVGWFDPSTDTGKSLTEDFDQFFYPGNTFSLRKQVEWALTHLDRYKDTPVFLFMNIGETHVPYYYEGAPWSHEDNPCVPFSDDNDAVKCRTRQKACLEYVDSMLEPLIRRFVDHNILICGDHGDCWGEDGLWEHGIHHEKVFEVPLVFSLKQDLVKY